MDNFTQISPKVFENRCLLYIDRFKTLLLNAYNLKISWYFHIFGWYHKTLVMFCLCCWLSERSETLWIHWLCADECLLIALKGFGLIHLLLWVCQTDRERRQCRENTLLFLNRQRNNFRMKLVHLVKIKHVFHRLRCTLRKRKHVR